MNEMNKLCKGCYTYEQYKKNPKYGVECAGYKIRDKNCPCMNCLIKVMCLKACDELEKRPWPMKELWR